MRACLLSIGLALWTVHVYAATATGAGYEQLRKISGQNDAGGANALCVLLSQAYQQANSNLGKVDLQREWEGLAYDCQLSVEKLNAPAATKAFMVNLPRLMPQAQATLAIALKRHAFDEDLGKALVNLLRNTRDFQVQVAAMECLGVHSYTPAVPEIVRLLNPRNLVSVQVAACRALAQIPSADGIDGLIRFLSDWKNGRMRYEATMALQALTGQQIASSGSAWLNWWEKNKSNFQSPQSTTPKFNYELYQDGDGEDLSYYEIPFVENRVVFVLDISGSMQFGGSPNRLEKARNELKGLINRLPERTHFNIITYSTEIIRWQQSPGLVPATTANKRLAHMFLDRAKPLGGTETMGAMEDALRNIALPLGVETIFLVSDGVPMPMQHTGRREQDWPKGIEPIRQRIDFINQTLKVRIHTIGIYTRSPNDTVREPALELMQGFLKAVANNNDGVYKEVK